MSTLLEIPDSIVDEALTAHFIMMNWSYWSVDVRCTQVERIEHHIGEIVSALLIKQATGHLKLPNNK